MIETTLLATIKKFCKRHRISPTSFGVKSANDPNLIPDLEGGRELRSRTRKRVETYLEKLSKKAPKDT